MKFLLGAISDDIYKIHNPVDEQKFQLCLSAAPSHCFESNFGHNIVKDLREWEWKALI